MESHAFCNFIVIDIRNMSTNSKEFAILVSIWQYVKINNSQHTQMLYGKSQGYGGLRAGNIHPNGYLFIETGPFFREVRPLLTDWLHFGQKQFGIFVIFTIGIIINFGQIFAVLGQFSLGSSTYISWIHGILFQQIINRDVKIFCQLHAGLCGYRVSAQLVFAQCRCGNSGACGEFSL